MHGIVASSQPLLLATRSAGKLRELLPLLHAASFSAETLDDAGLMEESAEDALEVFDSFEENALAKARWFAARAPGRVVVADDSGLVVRALDGAPGVRSKRWAGASAGAGSGDGAVDAANNAHLMRELERVGAHDAAQREAAYVCVAAAVWPGGELIARGETTGILLTAPRGSGGFGYDPYFASTELGGRTFAEVLREEKAGVSHRGRAFRELLASLARPMA